MSWKNILIKSDFDDLREKFYNAMVKSLRKDQLEELKKDFKTKSDEWVKEMLEEMVGRLKAQGGWGGPDFFTLRDLAPILQEWEMREDLQ
jgi:hypothetical protein